MRIAAEQVKGEHSLEQAEGHRAHLAKYITVMCIAAEHDGLQWSKSSKYECALPHVKIY